MADEQDLGYALLSLLECSAAERARRPRLFRVGKVRETFLRNHGRYPFL